MKRKLLIATETFPYGDGEKTFILPELKRLSEKYDVTIVSHAKQAILQDIASLTILEPSIKVINIEVKLNFIKQIFYLCRYLLDRDGWNELAEILRGRHCIFSRVYQSIGFYALAMENYKMLRRQCNLNSYDIFYSFWYFYYTYSITKYRKQFPNLRVITRVHGFDLYNERYAGGRQPFKRIMTSQIDRIYFISETGREYFVKQYKNVQSKKCVVSRLGTEQNVRNPINKQSSEIFRIVSCSSVIPLKRVELIIDALERLNFEQVDWIHFGDGVEYAHAVEYAKEKLGKKANIRYSFRGNTENQVILDFYKEIPVDCFITTSSTEGLPISIQEAMASGIPIIGTNVGGIPEMIDRNGILLSANPTAEEVATAICYLYYMSIDEKEILRKYSYEIWQEKFSADKNIASFIQSLDELYCIEDE